MPGQSVGVIDITLMPYSPPPTVICETAHASLSVQYIAPPISAQRGIARGRL